MRLGFVLYGDLQRQSGGYLYDRMLVEHLQKGGWQVEVIAFPWRNYLLHLTDNFSPRYRKLLASQQLDCLIQDELNHPSLFLLNRALRPSLPFPIVTIVHHLRCLEERPAWQNLLYRLVERQYLSGLDGWVFNSTATRDSVFALIGALSPNRYVIAYPAGNRWHSLPAEVDILERARQRRPLRLLFVGNLIPRKGLHLLLEALSNLPQDAFHLDIVGDPNPAPAYVSRLKKQLHRLSLQDHVRFWGWVDHQHLAGLYRQAQVFVMPSFHEGFGIAYLEAMGFGLPVLATRQGGTAEWITHGVNGYLIEPGDIQALASALDELNANREKLAEMSLAARRRYLQHPTWEQSMGQVTNWLEDLVYRRTEDNGRRT